MLQLQVNKFFCNLTVTKIDVDPLVDPKLLENQYYKL